MSRVTEAGALAAVVYNNRPGGFGGRLQKDGVDIKVRMQAREVEATVSLVMETRDSRNVIAEKPGSDENAGVVVIGGHFDTVPDTQGANDNGSGVATMIAVARAVSGKSYPFTIRYIAFGAEEVGLFGSRHYVGSITQGEQREIIAMLNLDVPGSGDFVEVIGSVDLVTEAVEYGDANDLDVRRGGEGRGGEGSTARGGEQRPCVVQGRGGGGDFHSGRRPIQNQPAGRRSGVRRPGADGYIRGPGYCHP